MTGCVSFLFTEMGLITIVDEDGEVDEEKLMEVALEAGAADFEADEGCFEITTEPDDLESVKDALVAQGFTPTSAEITMLPSTYVNLDEETAQSMEKMLDYFDENEDVTDVYHNWEA